MKIQDLITHLTFYPPDWEVTVAVTLELLNKMSSGERRELEVASMYTKEERVILDIGAED